MFYKKAAPMVARAMAQTAMTRSIGLMRPSAAVGIIRTYYRAHEDQSTILPNNIDTQKPQFKVQPGRKSNNKHGVVSCTLHGTKQRCGLNQRVSEQRGHQET